VQRCKSTYSTNTSGISQNQINILNSQNGHNDPDIQIYFSYTTGHVAVYCPSISCSLNIEIVGSFSYSLPNTSSLIPVSGNPGTIQINLN